MQFVIVYLCHVYTANTNNIRCCRIVFVVVAAADEFALSANTNWKFLIKFAINSGCKLYNSR